MSDYIDQLRLQIQSLSSQIESIQNECSHPKAAVTEKNGANTGGYDRDVYWVDKHCRLCDKQWRVDC
jgi:hypothetical protein